MVKKLLTLLFLFAILYSPYSHSNILDDLLGNMSTNDVKLYDKTYTDIGEIPSGDYGYSTVPGTKFKAKIKNLNQEKSMKEVWITIETLDCKKGCKNCILADIGTYEVLYDEGLWDLNPTQTILRPNTVFQVNFNIGDETAMSTYVQTPGNITCYSSYIDKVKGFHVFE